jgi:pyruvate dehydrogenase E1 component alpha subunit
MKYSAELLHKMYERMVTIRLFEEKANELFLAGELPGFLHLYIGEESIAVGVCANLTDKDYIASTHRGHGHCIAKGVQVEGMMAELFGKKTGCCRGKGGSMHIADFSVGMLGANGVVGGGYNLTVGAALASQLRKTDEVAVPFFGDGASNRGTFHEAMNMAAAWKLPVVFVCENNQWASTTPYRTTTAVENIADRAVGYGMPSMIIENGNDVFAVYEAAKKAVEMARSGAGPVLLEAKTYRIKGHFVGDPEMYRTKEEVKHHFETNDPLVNFSNTVIKNNWMKKKDLETIQAAVAARVLKSVELARQADYPDAKELFTDIYVEGGVNS